MGNNPLQQTYIITPKKYRNLYISTIELTDDSLPYGFLDIRPNSCYETMVFDHNPKKAHTSLSGTKSPPLLGMWRIQHKELAYKLHRKIISKALEYSENKIDLQTLESFLDEVDYYESN